MRFNDPSMDSEDLVIAPTSNPKASRKRPRDDYDAQYTEELIAGSGLFAKRPQIPGCPDMKEWLLKNKNPASLQDPDIWDHYAESLRFSSDKDFFCLSKLLLQIITLGLLSFDFTSQLGLSVLQIIDFSISGFLLGLCLGKFSFR